MTSTGAHDGRVPRDRPEILVTWPDYDAAAPELGGALAAEGWTIRLAPRTRDRTPAEVAGLARTAAGAIVSTDPFDRSVLEACRHLRVIARVGVGLDSIDVAAATALGVAVTTTPGANEPTVADHALGLMLAVLRRICEHDAAIRRSEWRRTGGHTPRMLTGLTVGLVGYGRIGRLVAERLVGFGVRIVICDPAFAATNRLDVVALDTLLRVSDVVSLHVPLTPETRGMIGSRELALMRPDAVLVNTARGGVVDEDALARALEQGRLAGAALDVFESEPPTGSPLLGDTRVVLSPHNAALSMSSVHEMTRRATASVIAVLKGRTPDDLANPDVVQSPSYPIVAGADA